ASMPVLGSVSTICIQRCSRAPPSGRKIASMVKVLAPTSGRSGKKRAVSLPLNCTALPTGESTSLGLPSTLGVMPPIRDRLSNLNTVLPACALACVQASLAEIANMLKVAAIAMLHLLIRVPSHLFLWPDVDASSPPLQSPPQRKALAGETFMTSLKGILASALLLSVAVPALAQPGGDGGPPRIVWAAHKDTPYTGVNKPVTHVADILKKHAG